MPRVLPCRLEVLFHRHPSRAIESAAGLMKLHTDRVRAYHLPGFDRVHYALHMYFDMQGVQHKLPHNTNATQVRPFGRSE